MSLSKPENPDDFHSAMQALTRRVRELEKAMSRVPVRFAAPVAGDGGRARWGVVQSAPSGNTIALKPCKSATDGTVSPGAKSVTCFLFSPSTADPDVEITTGDILAYLPSGNGGGVIINAMPAGSGEECSAATPATIGAGSEGSETADTATFAGGTAVEEWYVSRLVYNHAGDKKLYAMMRKRIFNSCGKLVSISAETRVEVDAAEAC